MPTALREAAIVVTGEALIDLVVTRDGDLRGHPGGGPYNVARTIARLGQPAVYLGRISGDPLGDRLRRQLDRDGVRLEAIVDTDALTTLAMAEIDAAGIARYRFYEHGTSAPGLTFEEATAAMPTRTETFYLGTLGLIMEPLATTLERLVRGLGDDTLVALDPNCRPSVIGDPAAFRGRLARLLARTDVFKASEEDLAWLAPGVDAVTAARQLLVRPGAVALVTLGAAGACVVTAGEAIEVAAPAVDVIDTIGAGDAFMGAFLARWASLGLGRQGLAQLEEIIHATRFACGVAALTCARAGADPPYLRDLEPEAAPLTG
jgi:fructokinase